MKYYLPKGLTYELISEDYPIESLLTLKQSLSAAIQSEQDWSLLDESIAAGPTIRWVEYSHGNVGGGKIWALATIQALHPGKPSPFEQALNAMCQDGCIFYRGSGDSTSLSYIEGNFDSEWKKPHRQALVVLAGGDAVGIPVWFELTDPTEVCPFSTEGETWETWGTFEESHKPIKKGSKWYRSNLVGATGDPLSASAWTMLYLGSQLTVISEEDFRNIPNDELP